MELYFPWDEDLGLDKLEFPIVLVYNSVDHYVATRLLTENYKDCCDELIENLNSSIALCNSVSELSGDIKIKKQFGDMSNSLKADSYATQSMVKHILLQGQGTEATGTQDKQSPSKRRKAKEAIQTRQIPSSLTDLHCSCGKLKKTEEGLLHHIERRHSNQNWDCVQPECGSQCTTSKALKKHYRNFHLKEFLHYCLYCPFGRDSALLVANHMASKHSMQFQIRFKCDECQKAFPTQTQVDKHKKTHLGIKPYTCQFCHKTYATKWSKGHHEAVKHTKAIASIVCSFCGKTYMSKTSYVAHYNKACMQLVQNAEEELAGQASTQEADQLDPVDDPEEEDKSVAGDSTAEENMDITDTDNP